MTDRRSGSLDFRLKRDLIIGVPFPLQGNMPPVRIARTPRRTLAESLSCLLPLALVAALVATAPVDGTLVPCELQISSTTNTITPCVGDTAE